MDVLGPDLLYFTLILAVATALAMLLRLLKQPAIIAYILTGLLVGPALLGWTHHASFLETFSHIGIALLLFLVGINLDVRSARRLGMVSLVTGLGQIVFTSTIGFVIARALGFGSLESLYIAVALTFSSTIIIVKILTDKKDLDSLYGRIAVGFLVVQDVVAVAFLVLLGSFGDGGGVHMPEVAGLLAKAVLLGLLIWMVSKFLLNRLLRAAGESQEVLFLFSITLCFVVAMLFGVAGLSLEIGALLAGLLIAATPYSHEIASRIKPLRDFFIVLFFVVLGAQMQVGSVPHLVIPAVLLGLFVLIGNPLIVMVLMGLMGFGKRTAFLAGLTVAQISEFSLILLAVGLAKGHVTSDIMSMVTLVGIITIIGSTYLMIFADRVYARINKYLPYHRRGTHRHERGHTHGTKNYDALLFGADRIGSSVLKHLREHGKRVLVVDFNPEIVMGLQAGGNAAMFGDADDVEIYDELPVERARLVVSTLPDRETSMLLLKTVRKKNPQAHTILTATHPEDAIALYEEGADYVIIPHLVGGSHATSLVELLFTDLAGFAGKKDVHLAELRDRR